MIGLSTGIYGGPTSASRHQKIKKRITLNYDIHIAIVCTT